MAAPDARLERLARRASPVRVPRAVNGEAGLFVVDATWGIIQPLVLAPGVETVGELEVIEQITAGGALVDCRLASYLDAGTIPTAVNIPHTEIVERSDELDRDSLTVVFCNGPQCPASSDAVNALLQAGWPAHALAYYRGGIHDWVTLGLPLSTDGHTIAPAPTARTPRWWVAEPRSPGGTHHPSPETHN